MSSNGAPLVEMEDLKVWFPIRSGIVMDRHVGDVKAVDGVSLTIAELTAEEFAVALIPHTLEATTLSSLAPAQEVNLEVDVLAKYVERLAVR